MFLPHYIERGILTHDPSKRIKRALGVTTL
jgi:hypothetical protein